MYTVRKIETEADFSQVRKLWTLHARMMRTPIPERTDLDTGVIIGAFQDEVLVACMRYIPFPDSRQYSIDSLYIKPSLLKYYSSIDPADPVTPILDHIIEDREAAGCFTWYYVRVISPGYTKVDRAGHGFLSSSTRGRRYERYLLEVVPKNTRSEVKFHDTALLGQRTYERDIMVVMCCLKNEFRAPAQRLGEDKAQFV